MDLSKIDLGRIDALPPATRLEIIHLVLEDENERHTKRVEELQHMLVQLRPHLTGHDTHSHARAGVREQILSGKYGDRIPLKP